MQRTASYHVGMNREIHSVVRQSDGTFAVVEESRGDRKLLGSFHTESEAEAEADRLRRAAALSLKKFQSFRFSSEGRERDD
jgi:hypothetical protein